MLYAAITFLQAASASALEADEITRAHIIEYSIAAYPGPCPCPYNLMRNGARCGNHSAYLRPGGYSPYCYEDDLSQDVFDIEKARLLQELQQGAIQF